MKLIVVALVLLAILSTVMTGNSMEAAHPVAVQRDIEATDLDVFLASYRKTIERSRRPVVRIELAPFAADALTASKVGGRAWWPEGEAIPKDEHGSTLTLLAQINFAEVPAMAGYPSTGLLQFFISATDLYGANLGGGFSQAELSVQRNFRVVYWPDLTRPAQGLAIIANDMLPHRPGEPRRMQFKLDREVMSAMDYRFAASMGGDTGKAVHDFARKRNLDEDEFNEALAERFAGNGHKLGGYPQLRPD